MLKIKADDTGRILSWGTDEGLKGEAFNGPLPADFTQTASLGKYTFHDGEIAEVEGWSAPEPAPEVSFIPDDPEPEQSPAEAPAAEAAPAEAAPVEEPQA